MFTWGELGHRAADYNNAKWREGKQLLIVEEEEPASHKALLVFDNYGDELEEVCMEMSKWFWSYNGLIYRMI